MHSDRTILVTGGTGQQGAAAAAALAGRGWTVRVLARDASSAKARAVTGCGVQLVQASRDDRNGLQSAMAGAHTVFCVMPLVTSAMPEGSFERQLIEAKNVIDASVAAGVEDFVLSSASSAERKVNPNLHNKFLAEQYIRSTGRRATFIRPVAFMDNFVDIAATRALLPRQRPGEVLSALPAWRLEGIHTNHERTTHADLPVL
jgi:uncharacterized protein YbjT (DUF2867 family)